MNWYLLEDCSDCYLRELIYFLSCLLCYMSLKSVVLVSEIWVVRWERIEEVDKVWRRTCYGVTSIYLAEPLRITVSLESWLNLYTCYACYLTSW